MNPSASEKKSWRWLLCSGHDYSTPARDSATSELKSQFSDDQVMLLKDFIDQ
jgi:hypothetical protein